MIITRQDQPVNIGQLNDELEQLGLPGFEGVGRKNRDPDTGNIVAPFISLRFADTDVLTQAQLDAIDTVLAAHVPTPPPVQRDFRDEYSKATTDRQRIDIIAAALRLA